MALAGKGKVFLPWLPGFQSDWTGVGLGGVDSKFAVLAQADEVEKWNSRDALSSPVRKKETVNPEVVRSSASSSLMQAAALSGGEEGTGWASEGEGEGRRKRQGSRRIV